MKDIKTFSLFENNFPEDMYLLNIGSYYNDFIYEDKYIPPPISTYCTEDYECSGGQCSACLDCQTDCKADCQTGCMSSCMDSSQTGGGSGGGSGHTHKWSSFVFSYVDNDYHDKYKYCLVGGERHPDQDYRVSHNVSSWGSWYNDPSEGKCKSQGTCGDCGKTIAKWKRHYLTPSFERYSNEQHKYVEKCSDCDYTLVVYEPHRLIGSEYVENGWVKQDCGDCGEKVLIRQIEKLPPPSIRNLGVKYTQAEIGWYTNSKASQIIIEWKDSSQSWSSAQSISYPANMSSVTSCILLNLNAGSTYNIRAMYISSSLMYDDSSWSSILTITTISKPNRFYWTIPPVIGGYFKETVTATKWRELQDTINGWRSYKDTFQFSYYTAHNGEGSFTIATKGVKFDAMYFNQVINAISTIPTFNGTLPQKKTSGEKCLASDFIKIQNAVNIFI